MNLIERIIDTWNLLGVGASSKLDAFFQKAIFLLTPLICALGIFLAMAYSGSTVTGLFIAFFVFVVIILLTTSNTEQAKAYVREETPSFYEPSSTTPTTHPHPLSPRFYEGAGEWMVDSHVPSNDFLDAILPNDPNLRSVPNHILRKSVQYNHAINVYSPNSSQEAIKIVPPNTPSSFPITRLKASYDYRYSTD